MTIDKAIEILSDLTYHGIHADDQDLEDAHKMGIEALKRYKEVRQQLTFSGMPLLPSETKD